MTLFDKSWNTDLNQIQLCGIIFGAVTVFIYPYPQLISGTAPGTLFSLHTLGVALFILFSILILRGTQPEAKLAEVAGISGLRSKDFWVLIKYLVATVFAVSAVTSGWIYTLKKLKIPFDETQELLRYADFSQPETFVPLFIMAVIAVPFAEELIFRRYLFELIAKLTGYNASGVITSLLFSAAHGFLAGAPGLFLMGLLLQRFYTEKKNILHPTLLHMSFNATTLLIKAYIK